MINKENEYVVMVLSNPFKPDLRVYKEAKSLQKMGYRIAIICWDRDCRYRESECIDGIIIRRIGIRATYGTGLLKLDKLFLFFLQAIRLIKKYRFVTIHCHDLDTLPVGVFFKVLYKKKVVYDTHENFAGMVLMSSPYLVSFLVSKFEKLLLRFVDSVIVASSIFGDELRRSLSKPIVIIGNWHDPPMLDSRAVRALRRKFLRGYDLLLTYIGGLDKSRSIVPMIKTIKDFPNVMFVICGDGYQRDSVINSAAGTKNVKYLGAIAQKEVPYYTAASDVIYYVMDYSSAIARYNAPNSLGFALATGRAVMASENGELGRVVKEFKCGVTVRDNSEMSLREALKLLLIDREIAKMKKRSYDAGRSFYNWRSMEQRLAEVYSSISVLR